MKSIAKKTVLLSIAAIMLVLSVLTISKKVDAGVMYNNASSAALDCSVNSSGYLQAVMLGTGNAGTSRIAVELYVEKRVMLIFWKRVDIGYPNNTWTDHTSNNVYSHTFTTALPSSGTYRVTATYTFSGSGGPDDVITRTDTVSF